MDRHSALVLTVCGALALGGCGEREVASGTVTDPATGKQADYKVTQDADSSTVRMKTADGEAVIRTGEGAAANLPDGFTVYPGAKVVSSLAAGGANAGNMVNFETGDAPDKVLAFYRAAAGRAGYAIESEGNVNGTHMLGGRKGEKEAFQIMVMQTGGKTSGTLVIGG